MAIPIHLPLPISNYGDLIAGNIDGNPARLALGEVGQVLSALHTGGAGWKDAPFYDARDYVTDWGATPATFMTYYQNALNAISADGGGTLVFPYAAYKMSVDIGNRVDIPSNVRLLGAGGYFNVSGGAFGNAELIAAGESGGNYLGVGFRIRSTSDGTAKENITIEGLEFRGEYNGVWRGNTYYQSSIIDGWMTGSNLNRNIHVRNNSFKNIYGFPMHVQAQNDTGTGLSSGYLFSFTNNTIDTCGNGINTNWPNSLHAHNQFYNSEGFECAGINTTIIHNIFRDAFGAISLGGDTTAGRELPGGIVAFNQIDIDYTDSAIVLQDGAVGALIAFNIIKKARNRALLAGTASSGVAPRDCQIIGNQAISCGQIIPAWAATTAYAVGDWVHKTVGTYGDAFVCITAGTSGGVEPTWPTVDGDTVTSGTATFRLKGNFDTSSRHAFLVQGDKMMLASNRLYVEADDAALWSPTESILVQGDDCSLFNNDVSGSTLYDIDIDGTSGLTKGQRTRVSGNRTGIDIKVQRGAQVVNGSDLGRNYKAYSSGNHTVRYDEEFITMDPSGSSRTFTLPTAVGVPGKKYHFLHPGTTGTVTIDGSGSETINGSTTYVLVNQYDSVTISSDGSNWLIISEML